MDLRRLLIAAVMALALGATLAWLQSSFDKGDLKRAMALLDDTRPPAPGSPSLQQALAKRLGHEPVCDAEITQGCRGIVQIRCEGGAGGGYLFDADLARRPPVLHPANPRAQELMVELFQRSGLTPPTGGALPVIKLDGGK
ncbi:MAG: hypothetical protein ACYDCL_05525 [Myxococcales bacterium]